MARQVPQAQPVVQVGQVRREVPELQEQMDLQEQLVGQELLAVVDLAQPEQQEQQDQLVFRE